MSLSDAPQHDHHVRIWWFVLNHEYQHMLWAWIHMAERERDERLKALKATGWKPMTDEERYAYNVAQDMIINDLLLDSGIK